MLGDRQDDDRPLEFLTIPQAGKVLGLGRTKAYAMAKRFRDTDGREGLPNVDFWGSPRVPVWALKKLVDEALAPRPVLERTAPEPADVSPPDESVTEPTPLAKPKRTRRHRPMPADHPGLFDLPPAS